MAGISPIRPLGLDDECKAGESAAEAARTIGVEVSARVMAPRLGEAPAKYALEAVVRFTVQQRRREPLGIVSSGRSLANAPHVHVQID